MTARIHLTCLADKAHRSNLDKYTLNKRGLEIWGNELIIPYTLSKQNQVLVVLFIQYGKPIWKLFFEMLKWAMSESRASVDASVPQRQHLAVNAWSSWPVRSTPRGWAGAVAVGSFFGSFWAENWIKFYLKMLTIDYIIWKALVKVTASNQVTYFTCHM